MDNNREDIIDYILNNRIVNVNGWYHYLKTSSMSDDNIDLFYENTQLEMNYYIRINLSKPFKFSFYSGEKIQKKVFQKAFYKSMPRSLKIQKLLGE